MDCFCRSDVIESCLRDFGGFIVPIDIGVTVSLLDCTWYVGRDEIAGEMGCTGVSDIGWDCVTGDVKGGVMAGCCDNVNKSKSRSIKAKPTTLLLNMLPHTSSFQDVFASMTASTLIVAPFALPTRLSKSTLTVPFAPVPSSVATVERSSNR